MESSELQALLAELRQTQDGPTPPPAGPPPSRPSQQGPPSPSQLDSILSSLLPPPPQPSSHPSSSSSLPPPSPSELTALLNSLSGTSSAHPSTPPLPPPPQRDPDLTALSFPEALPILQRLAMDESLIGRLSAVRDEQEALEAELKEERGKKEAELKRTIGSPHMRASRLKEWDRSARERWKQLQDKQQSALQRLGVPTFCVSRDPRLLKRQERVMTVLIGFLDDAT